MMLIEIGQRAQIRAVFGTGRLALCERLHKETSMGQRKKPPSMKKAESRVASDASWTIVWGELIRQPGRPASVKSLFKVIGEKIPYEFLEKVKTKVKEQGLPITGVYIAHDSMGYPRYIGRGNIFERLGARRKAQVLELAYFSFFVVEEKIHEREIETIMIRSAGSLLDFNSRKVRNNIKAGDVRDFESGTRYVERQYKRGRKRTKPRRQKRLVRSA
jgi:hypothetical protein